MSLKPKRKNTQRKVPSKGQLNRIADSMFHPFYEKTPLVRIIDGLAHAAIEQNPKESAKKFIIYNSYDLLKKIFKKL